VSRRRIAEIAFLVLAPIAIFAVSSELLLRLYLSRNIFYDVEMSRYGVELKVDSPNPLVGHHHAPDREVRLMGVTLRTNADGFRDDDYPVERDGRRRIVFLGDSLTLGWGVEKQHTFEHRLEARLDERSPTEIINLGVGNYNTTQEVNLFVDKGMKYEPDQVVLFYFINDAEPVPQKARFPGLGHSRLVTFYWSRIKMLMARITPTAGYREYYQALYREGADGWKASREALAQLAALRDEHGFDLRVVILPELHDLEDYPFEAEHARVAAAARELDIPVLDLAPRFAGQSDPQSLWVARDDAHPNARAHALIAQYSLDFIAEGIGS
jgi:lysophospholipase L1-like esterase